MADDKNVPIRNCYKADGTQYKGCQKLSTPNNKPFTRCDNATLNANTKALDYSCVIHLPNPSFKHPLLIAACEYQTSDAGDTLNQGCPLKKSCIDALRTNSSTPLNATECPLDSKYYKGKVRDVYSLNNDVDWWLFKPENSFFDLIFDPNY